MHRQSFWEEVAADRDLPLWQRVAALAFACHRANGHANFIGKNREIAFLLGRDGPSGRECVPANRISEAIARAKKAKWIDNESNSRCLVVPRHSIQGGLGKERDKCSVHFGKRTGGGRQKCAAWLPDGGLP